MLSTPLLFFFSLQQRKINCKERREFVFILPGSAAGARTEEDSCGGRLADPLPSASPMPCCTEPMTKQACRNTGQTLRASHWGAESTTANKKKMGGEKKNKKASHFQTLGFSSFSLIELCLPLSKMSRSHDRGALVRPVLQRWLAGSANKHALLARFNNSRREIRSSML